MFLLLAVALDVGANVALKYSGGFRRKAMGGAAILSVMAAFACMAQALQEIEMSVAYGLWGALGLCLTTLIDRIFFGQQFTLVGWLGLACTLWGVVLLHGAV